MRKKKIFLIIISIILILFLVNLCLNIGHKFNEMKEHKDYFDLPENQRGIEPWMTLRKIEREFDIEVPNNLGIKKEFKDWKKTLDEYTLEHNLDLNETIKILESSKKFKEESKKSKK